MQDIPGLPGVEIASDTEAESADYYVCALRSYLLDDVRAACSRCGAVIYHRPHAPRKPAKICMNCMSKVPGALEGPLMTTKAVAAEVTDYIKRKKQRSN